MTISFYADYAPEQDLDPSNENGLQCANRNVTVLLELLEIEFDFSGSISADELARKIYRARIVLQQRGEEFVRSSSADNFSTDLGLSIGHLAYYLDSLEWLVCYASRNGSSCIRWA